MHSFFLRHAWRALRRDKIYTVVSVVGLGVGMAITLLVSLWVFQEYTYDTFHKNGDRIYRVIKSEKTTTGHVETRALTGPPLADALHEEFAGIESTARLFRTIGLVHNDRIALPEQALFFADASIFDVFTFPLVAGDPASALSKPGSVVLSRACARRLFGADSPLGKNINLENDADLEVTGVLEDIPKNSHLQFDYLISYETLFSLYPALETYWDGPGWTYVLLSPGVEPAQIESRLPALVTKYRGTEAAAVISLGMQPLHSIHLGSFFGGEIEPKTDPDTLSIFIAAALLILFLAILNHNNLTTARAAARVRELAVRRVLGSNRMQMFVQWTWESVLIVGIASLMALGVAEMLRPQFAHIVNIPMSADIVGQGITWTMLFCLAALTIAVTSIYPAHYALTFKTAALLRYDRSMTAVRSFMRRSLVIVQFSVGIALVLCAAIAFRQVTYLQDQDLGFNPEDVVVVRLPDSRPAGSSAVLRDRLRGMSGVKSVTAASHLPGGDDCYGMSFEQLESGELQMLQFFDIDQSFASCMELNLVSVDSSLLQASLGSPRSCLISESAAARFTSPPEVGSLLGLVINSGGKSERVGDVRVAGIITDFHARNLFYRQHPMVLMINPDHCRYLLIRIDNTNESSTLAGISEAWSTVEPDHPFVHSFLRDELASMYSGQARFAELLGYASLIAIVLACVGLLSLGSFMLARRTREIGVRKALGATTAMVARLLSTEMIWLVAIANFVAWPIAYWLMSRWLDNYVYHTSAHPIIFFSVGLISAIIAQLVVSYHTFRAASRNPVDALRHE